VPGSHEVSASIPAEPLAESAPLAQRLAQAHCRPLPATGEDCAWYHGFWQFLRLMGLSKTSGGQGGFLIEILRGLARAGESPRVMVSGSADYSMPAHALWAYRAEHAVLSLAVVDRCEAPLALCRWYADTQRAVFATHCCDVRDHEPAEPVDVVFTNSFLGSFDPACRPLLVAAWRRQLRPGGKVVFTNRLRPGAGTEAIGFDGEQALRFVEAARQEAEARRANLGLDPGEAARRARAYAERYRSYPVRSADEIAQLLTEGGFALEILEVTTNPGRQGAAPVTGPSTAERAEYARVVATRL
jgi:SAM-dependent methyltransferase